MPDAFKPNAIGPVDPGYLLGPGDVLRLAVWGQAEFQHELTVSTEGKIFIPVVGQVYVTGIPFQDLQEKVKNLLSRHYSGLSGQSPRTFMDLTVAKLRPIRIFIMGEVRTPGGYTVSSYATVFNALYSMGGPLTTGTLRNIEVYREQKKIASVDIYDYLLKGQSGDDVRLQNNDIIFVPPRGKTVSVKGQVLHPAIYELEAGEQLRSLLSYAGSVKTNTNVDRAQISRVLPFEKRDASTPSNVVIDLDLREYINRDKDFTLYDMDAVSVFALAQDLSNIVSLSGAVQYPGTYQSDNLTLKELVFTHGRPVESRAFPKRADLIRLNSDLVTTTIFPLDLERLKNDQAYDQPVQPGDEVIIYDIEVEIPTDRSISVSGDVRNSGSFPLSDSMTVVDAILRAGGFAKSAYRKKAEVLRSDTTCSDEQLAVSFSVELPESLDYLTPQVDKFFLKENDRVVVRPDPCYIEKKYVSVEGLARFPGQYVLEKREQRLSDILDSAGGLMTDAFLCGARITRGGQRVVVDFNRAYHLRKKTDDIILQSGDIISIPPCPNSVRIDGNVNNPGLYGYIKGKKLKSYVNRAGGLLDSTECILITMPSGETRKAPRYFGNSFRKIPDGAAVVIKKKPPTPPKEEKTGPSVTDVIRDTLAIVVSAVTVIVLIMQLEKL
jgi:protein involved in polysaccharide export with SLBB domain